MLSALTCRVCFSFPISISEASGALSIKCVLRIKPSCCSSLHPSGLLTLMLELTNHTALHISSYSSLVPNQGNQLSSLCALCSLFHSLTGQFRLEHVFSIFAFPCAYFIRCALCVSLYSTLFCSTSTGPSQCRVWFLSSRFCVSYTLAFY